MMQHKKISKDHTVRHKINKRIIALHQGSGGIRYQQPSGYLTKITIVIQ